MSIACQLAFGTITGGHGLAAVVGVALCGLVLGATSMSIYGALAPQKRITALKVTIADAQLKLRKYDGTDPRHMFRLTSAAILPALHQFALIVGPTIVAIVPVFVIGGWLNRHFAGRAMYAAGPHWFRSWEVPFTVALSIGALSVKLIQKNRIAKTDGDAFQVTLGTHLMTGAVHHARPLWRALGNIETDVIRRQLDGLQIIKPIYVAGLARSGTSMLIEILASHPAVATHQYRDFPFLFIPYWWRQTLQRSATSTEAPAERAHGDRMMVTSHSPEAMEEVLWMSFFRDAHRSGGQNALDGSATNPAFEKFYRDHIRKLLLISGRSRYAAKGNYNLTRLAYLQKLFPDARFVLPIRHPRDHIASLIKQHRIFTAAATKHPRSVAHLDRVGHFEFGTHRRCINPHQDSAVVESIEKLWREGQEVRGWARYWSMLYGWVDEQLNANDRLRDATMVMKYESLCEQPEQLLKQLLVHCSLADPDDALAKRWVPSVSRPTYYRHSFTIAEQEAIAEETNSVALRWGYSPEAIRDGSVDE